MNLVKSDIQRIQALVNKNLKVLRVSEDISQDQLAEMLDISRNTISLLELGKKTVSPAMALAIYYIFRNCDLLKLIEQDNKDR